MNRWKDVLIGPDTTIHQAIATVDAGGIRIAIVVDSKQRMLGTLTDGDVRRALLRGVTLESPVTEGMNRQPVTVDVSESRDAILGLMRSRGLLQVPLIDANGRVVGIETLPGMLQQSARENWVLIMAGGLGERLGDLTASCPKPMLRIGGKPILETILESFIEHGFRNFFLSVNYKADVIKEHFGAGDRWGVSIRYLEESVRLGTAGPMSLLPGNPGQPIIVMNGDILTKVNFNHLLDFHAAQGVPVTVCVREHGSQIPYGVVDIDNNRVRGLREKPIQRHHVAAGIYVVSPDVLSRVPVQKHFDMPELLQSLIRDELLPAAFPIHEYWIDVGRVEDYQRAHFDYPEFFG